MQAWQEGLAALAVAVALLSLGLLLWRRTRSEAELLFAVVSGSLALSLLAPSLAGAPPWLQWAAAIGGSATCNGFWLVSRALFRGEGGVRPVHVAVAVGVAGLIAASRGAGLEHAPATAGWRLALDGFLGLASSLLLGLSFLEAARGRADKWPRAERRLRRAFMVLFGTVVLANTAFGALADTSPGAASLRGIVVALSAMAMIGFTHVALWHRRRWPLAAARPRPVAPAPGSDEARVVAALRHQLEVLQVFREPELKVADLARRLGLPEHRLSRLLGQALGEKNFNQLVNRYRVAHACRLLADPDGDATILDISTDCGFASLGPFNRAFKAAMGLTPSAYRARCRAGAAAAPGPAGLGAAQEC